MKQYFNFRRRNGASLLTIRAEKTRLQKLSSFLKQQHLSYDTLGSSDISEFVSSLGQYSTAYAHNILSAMNNYLRYAGRSNLIVSPARTTRRKRTRVRTEPLDFSLQNILEAADQAATIDARFKAIILTCAALGLRLNEAILLEPREALRTLRKCGHIDVIHGSKGGRSRTVERLTYPIFPIEQTLEETLPLCRNLRGNLLEEDETSKKFSERCQRFIQPILKKNGIRKIHDLRAFYAVEVYENLSGFDAPIRCNKRPKGYSKSVDQSVRMEISTRLGHSRVDVTNTYLGKSHRS